MSILAIVVAIRVGIAYAAWADRHLALYYAAVEVGREPVYESGHYAVGWVLGVGLAAAISVAIVAGVVATIGASPADGMVIAAASAIGAMVPAGWISPVYAFLVGVVGVVWAGAILMRRLLARARAAR
ncbi:MAG TPA: hypothetical protein VN107_11655 [Microbacterium sp.]|nr:hypothetical protein [Microbacterium sp.]